jgi:hypothetical protein
VLRIGRVKVSLSGKAVPEPITQSPLSERIRSCLSWLPKPPANSSDSNPCCSPSALWWLKNAKKFGTDEKKTFLQYIQHFVPFLPPPWPASAPLK